METPQYHNGIILCFEDRISLQEVILNLLINTIEAMCGAGEGPRELWVSSEKVTEILVESGENTLEYKASAEADRTHVLIAVRDLGPGLDLKSLDRLFAAFYTTKPQGLGMGLAISRSIIEARGGRLWTTANTPQGTAFQFTLPIREEMTVMIDTDATVFVVEDDAPCASHSRTSFTPREREVMARVVAGLLNKQIGAELGTSETTVKIHRHQVMAKMGAGSLPELVRMADRLGILVPKS